MQRRIDAAARDAGREPQEIRRVLNVSGQIGGAGDGPLDGPVSGWVAELARLVLEAGMDTFIFWPREDHVRQVELFAAEVAPAVREAVEAGRAGSREAGGPRYT